MRCPGLFSTAEEFFLLARGQRAALEETVNDSNRPLAYLGFRILFSLVFLVAAAALLSAPLAHAKGAAPEAKERVAFLVQAPVPLKNVLQTARRMLAGEEFAAREVSVVVCGEAVRSLQSDGQNAELVRESHRDGVRVVACGLTLLEKDIAPSSLAPQVQVVPNGLTELLRLQSLGYRTLEL